MNPDDAVATATAGAPNDSPSDLRAAPPNSDEAGCDFAERNALAAVLPQPGDPIDATCAPLFAEYLLRGAKPASEWRCGVEFEVFGYDARRDYARLTPPQVEQVLSDFAGESGALVREGDLIVEAYGDEGDRLTVEPGGQIEFSGAPRRAISETGCGLRRWLARLHETAEERGFVLLAGGFDPLRTLSEQQWFPKRRYGVMRPYLAGRGARAWDMMTRTCAVQVNLDYGSETDLVKKFLVGNRLAPFVTAMFANSPFAEGRPTGYKSTRAAAWLDTDPARSGLAPPALTDDFSPDAYVAYALRTPMLFAVRDGEYSGVSAGVPFGDFLRRGAGGLRPLFRDWPDHLSTIFTDARLKQHVELRNADGGSVEMALALQALWKGLLYDAHSLDEALRLAPRLDAHDAHELRAAVARDALAARHASVSVLPLAKEIVALAAEGLRAVAPDEDAHLDVLRAQVCEDEVSPADILLRNWHGLWNASPARLVAHLRVA